MSPRPGRWWKIAIAWPVRRTHDGCWPASGGRLWRNMRLQSDFDRLWPEAPVIRQAAESQRCAARPLPDGATYMYYRPAAPHFEWLWTLSGVA